MQAVKKIESMKGIKFLIKPFACEIIIFGKSAINQAGDSKEEAVFLAVVDFIKLNQMAE